MHSFLGQARHLVAALAFACATGVAVAEVPTDRLIVRLAGGAPAKAKSAADRQAIAARLSERTGEAMRPLRVMGDGAQVMQLRRRLKPAEVAALVARAGTDPDILEIAPDRIIFPALVPSDPLHASQWYLGEANGINAPAAWDITTGSPDLVIGIIDTGKLPHDDLVGRWVGGYDFVSLAARSNDGDLRDADPTDPGDWVTSGENGTGQPLEGCPTTDS